MRCTLAAVKGQARERAQEAAPERRSAKRPPSADGPARSPSPTAVRALALQRTIGNRATGRILARWIKHPDEEEKGVMITDSGAAEYLRFNPPKNE